MKRKCAVFTIVQNEPVFIRVWSRYYQQHIAADDLYVLDHDSTDATTLETAAQLNRVPVHRLESFDHRWLRDVVERFQAFLLQSYELVLFVEVDEIVAPDPRLWPSGLAEFLHERSLPRDGFFRCTGYDIIHHRHDGEPTLDWDRPVLKQRRYCRRSEVYSKPLLSARPLEWSLGFHALRGPGAEMPPPDPELLLLHLHRADYETCRSKKLENASRQWSVEDIEAGAGYHNRIVEQEEFDRWFYGDFLDDIHTIEPLSDAWNVIV